MFSFLDNKATTESRHCLFRKLRKEKKQVATMSKYFGVQQQCHNPSLYQQQQQQHHHQLYQQYHDTSSYFYSNESCSDHYANHYQSPQQQYEQSTDFTSAGHHDYELVHLNLS